MPRSFAAAALAAAAAALGAFAWLTPGRAGGGADRFDRRADQNVLLITIDTLRILEGAALRVGLMVEDPRRADGMPAESSTYDDRAKQIATELLYLFSRVGPT